jgi:hypothetical protein
LLVTLACSPAFAETQALITVNPNNFAPGQNISTATVGATLRSVTFVANPDPSAPPEQAFVPQYSPVFAETVTAECNLAAIPCAPTGNSAFSYTFSATPSSQPIIWGAANHALDCAIGQCFGPPNIFLPLLRVDFASPTDTVGVMMTNFEHDNGQIGAFSAVAAFDDTGQLIGVCNSAAPAFGSGAVGCAGGFVVGPTEAGDGWLQVTLFDPTSSIRFVLIGGNSSDPMLSMLQFDSPVSLQLAGLLTRVKGVGPGKALFNDVMFAQSYYAVGDIPSTCAQLTYFVTTVKSQSGKKINSLTAAQFRSTAQAIEVALNCKY